MKQSLIKKISYIACCTMLAGAVGATAAYAVNENSEDRADTAVPAVEEKAEKNEDEPQKDEMVYVLAGATGNVNKIIVSDHLKNTGALGTLTETSDLKDVKNVKGDETYTENGGERTWNAAGSDIYYQGTSNDELPMDIKVTYLLNGTEMSAEEMPGKTGRVTVRFDYTNNRYETRNINGEEVKIYVPFAAVTGMMLDNEKFTNIEVTNGKYVDDGAHTFIVGTAFPGLSESLGADSGKITIPEYFEFSADVTGFEMTNTVTIATNEVFNGIDLDLGDKEATLTEDIDKLSDAMNQLTEGADKLHDGLSELLEKSSALTDGVGALYDGAAQLNDGAAKVNDGTAQLYTGSAKLSAGLDELTSNNATLTAGSKQVFESLLDMANKQLEESGITGYTLTIDNYGEVIDKIIASLDTESITKKANDTAKQQVTEAVEAKRDVIASEVTKAVREQVSAKVDEAVKAEVTEKVTEAVNAKVTEKVNEAVKASVTEKVNEAVRASVTEKVTEAVREKVFAGVLAAKGMTPEDYTKGVEAGVIDEATQAAFGAAVDAQLATDEVKAQITAAVDQQMQSDEVKAQAEAAVNEQMKSADVKAKIKAAIAEQTESDEVKAQTEAAIKEQLNSAEVKAKAEAATEEQMATDDVKAIIEKTTDEKVAELIDENLKSDEVQAKIREGLSTAKAGVTKLYDLKSQLDSYNTFYTGLAAYTDGVAQAADGAKQINSGLGDLSSGTAALADGTGKLYDGVSELNDKVPALIDGITKLDDGSGELADGVHKFGDEGVGKIVTLINGDLGNIIDRFKAVKDVSEGYETFTGGSGSVKFVYRTDAIEKD